MLEGLSATSNMQSMEQRRTAYLDLTCQMVPIGCSELWATTTWREAAFELRGDYRKSVLAVCMILVDVLSGQDADYANVSAATLAAMPHTSRLYSCLAILAVQPLPDYTSIS